MSNACVLEGTRVPPHTSHLHLTPAPPLAPPRLPVISCLEYCRVHAIHHLKLLDYLASVSHACSLGCCSCCSSGICLRLLLLHFAPPTAYWRLLLLHFAPPTAYWQLYKSTGNLLLEITRLLAELVPGILEGICLLHARPHLREREREKGATRESEGGST